MVPGVDETRGVFLEEVEIEVGPYLLLLLPLLLFLLLLLLVGQGS